MSALAYARMQKNVELPSSYVPACLPLKVFFQNSLDVGTLTSAEALRAGLGFFARHGLLDGNAGQGSPDLFQPSSFILE